MTTEQHLDAWLDRHYDPLDDTTDIRAAMLELVAQEPWLLNEGWWRVHDALKDS